MNPTQFQIGFWHPFGPHGGETVTQILERKRQEIDKKGWTLWSFQKRRSSFLHAWCRELAAAETVYVFCSEGKGAKDPPNAALYCTSYCLANETTWTPIPPEIRVPHPFRNQQTEATAFNVQQVIYPISNRVRPTLTWLSIDASGNERWRSDALPTRGEYLIRPGNGAFMRSYRAILVLKKPYLAALRSGTHQTPNEVPEIRSPLPQNSAAHTA